jgi:hypothetical protein
MSTNVNENTSPRGTRAWRKPCLVTSRAGPPLDKVIAAAVACYMDATTDEHIASALGCSRRTLARYKHREEFQIAFKSASMLYNILLRQQAFAWQHSRNARVV